MEYKKNIYSYYYEWWKNIDKFIFSIIILLFFIGLFFSLVSTSLIASDKLDTNDYSFFFKHLFFIFLGLAVMFALSSIDQKKLFFSIITNGMDPDDLLRKKGVEEFKKVLKSKIDIIDFIWDTNFKEVKNNNPYELAVFENKIKKIVSLIF